MTLWLDQAWSRARRLYPRSKGFQSAYVDGARARRSGKDEAACPYQRRRSGWTAWRRAWMRGWQSGEAAR